jgi:hypothetical protein
VGFMKDSGLVRGLGSMLKARGTSVVPEGRTG